MPHLFCGSIVRYIHLWLSYLLWGFICLSLCNIHEICSILILYMYSALWRRKWQPSILAWRIPWTEKSGGLQSMGSQRVGHDWVTNTHSVCVCLYAIYFSLSFFFPLFIYIYISLYLKCFFNKAYSSKQFPPVFKGGRFCYSYSCILKLSLQRTNRGVGFWQNFNMSAFPPLIGSTTKASLFEFFLIFPYDCQ